MYYINSTDRGGGNRYIGAKLVLIWLFLDVNFISQGNHWKKHLKTFSKTQKHIVKETRELKWCTRKYLFNTKEGSSSGIEEQQPKKTPQKTHVRQRENK